VAHGLGSWGDGDEERQWRGKWRGKNNGGKRDDEGDGGPARVKRPCRLLRSARRLIDELSEKGAA
jgi:hypothetical protein